MKHLAVTFSLSLMLSLSARSEPVDLETLASRNLVSNPWFEQASPKGAMPGWTLHPEKSDLIRSARDEREEPMLELLPGASALSLTSRAMEVSPEEDYTLAFDLKQESIHIGFGMGTRVMLIWVRQDGSRTPEVLDMIDGSFDWETASYSVTAPTGAKTLQVRLQKRGSPGKVFLRHVRIGQGTLQKEVGELQVGDFLKAQAAFEFIGSRIKDLLADKQALDIPVVKGALDEMETAIRQGVEMVGRDLAERKLTPSPDEKAKILWQEMLKGNVGFRVSPSLPYHDAWAALHRRLQRFEKEVNEWIARENTPRLKRAMEAAFGKEEGYAIGVDTTMLKLRREAPYTGEVAARTSLALARNEEEAVQISVAALDEPLGKVELSASGFLGPDGKSLARVSIHRIDYVRTNAPQYYAAGPVGWWPDVVFPARGIERIGKGEQQAFWLSVEADASTPAGDYTGEVTVSIDGKELRKIAVNVKVWDLTLPRPGKFEVIGCFHPYMLQNFYRWKEMKEDVVAEWNRYILHKRWNPTLYFAKSLTPRGEALKASVKEGINAINLIDPSKFLDRDESRTFTWPTAEQEQEIREAAKAARSDFLAAGGDPAKTKLLVSGFDEQHDREQYRLMKHVFGIAKEAVPEARSLTTTTYPPLEGLVGSVDTWVPLLGNESADLRARGEAGDQLHFYVYAHPFRPYPNPSLIDYPGVDGRVTFWLAARKGYSGFLHYLFNGWKANNELEGPRWPETDWLPYSGENQKSRNGSGYFIYPGPEEQPVSSVRMELVREGIEDWELIEMLRGAIAARETTADAAVLRDARAALAAAMELTPSLHNVTYDTRVLMATRARLAETLIALQK